MNLSGLPVNPSEIDFANDKVCSILVRDNQHHSIGITMREHFALEIFKALQSNSHPDNVPNVPCVDSNIRLAIESADKFLTLLKDGQ